MVQQTVDERITQARDAADRHAWAEAYDVLVALDAEGRLDGAGLELLGMVAWWSRHPEVATAAREKAFTAYLNEGDRQRAAFMALMVARDYNFALADAIAKGWHARAARILADEPEGFAHGYLLLGEIEAAAGAGDFERAIELAARAVDLGARYGDKDLQGFALVQQGSALVRRGDLAEGLSLLDEATAAAVNDELSPFATGIVYCSTISVCRDLADYRRAGQWTEVAERWCERQAISGFPGVCRVHRAEILALRGSWEDAESEARTASQELLLFRASPPAAEGMYTVGAIRLRMGDLAGAEEAFREAHDLGHDPQPGLSLLYLAQGRTSAAMTSMQRALGGAAGDRLIRSRLLPAYVEIAVAAADLDAARGAAEELKTLAEQFGAPALHATAHFAAGTVLVAAGQPDEAIHELTQARAQWQAVEAPYEVARTRVALASALRLHGEVDDAVLELETAHATFDRLGAMLDRAQSERLLGEVRGHADHGERARRTFMFTDIVGSTELIGVIGDEAWQDLVRWHDQTLRGLAAAHGGEEVNHAGDGFFLAFADVPSAVACAVAIQRALADHRRQAGFAPRVRIGLHAADATRVDEGYLGQGVHAAARIGAVAGAGEIVVSAETLDGFTAYGASEPRAVDLKGIAGTVLVRTIDWSTPAA